MTASPRRCIALLVLALAGAGPLAMRVLAHGCDKAPPTLRIGDTAIWWCPGQHLAVYAITGNTSPAVASIVQVNPPPGIPAANGEFLITGLSAGTTLITVEWIGVEFNPPPTGTCDIWVNVRSRSSSANLPWSGSTAEPTNTKTGEYTLHEPADFDLGGSPRMRFERHYGSALERDGAISALGPNWLHSFDWRCERGGHDDAYCTIFDDHGRLLRFDQAASGSWSTTDVFERAYQLVDEAGGLGLADLRSHLVRRFDALGQLVEVADVAGNKQTLTHLNGRLTRVDDGRGRAFDFVYDGFGRLADVVAGTRSVMFGYTNGLLTSATDPAGNVTNYEYDLANSIAGLLTSRRLPTGETPFRQAYDALGRVIEQSAATGDVERYAYPASGLFDATMPSGSTWRHVHDASGTLTQMTDALGRLVRLGKDASNRRNSIVDRLGAGTSWDFDASSREVARFTDATGRTTRRAFGSLVSGSLTFHPRSGTTLADGSVESRAFDAGGNVATFTDASGAMRSFMHDARGRITSATNALGATDLFTYDTDDTLASATNALGATTTFQYDGLGRLTGLDLPDGAMRRWEYDARDLPTAYVDEIGSRFEIDWDASGRPTEIRDPLGRPTCFRYDANGRFHEMVDRRGGITRYEYDGNGRPTALDGPMSRAFSLEWDALDRVTRVIDGAGFATTRAYDVEGALVSSTNPDGGAWRHQSDALGRVTRVTSPGNRSGSVSYDTRGNVIGATSASGRYLGISYDRLGRAAMAVYPGGLSTEIERDALGRTTAVEDTKGSRFEFGWDAAGRLDLMRDPLGRATTFTHDARGRVTDVATPVETMSLQYDLRGLVVQRSASDGTSLSYTYDKLRQLTATAGATFKYDAGGAVTESSGIPTGRDQAGRIESMDFAPGKWLKYYYDQRGLIELVVDWVGHTTRFEHDPCGRVSCWMRPSGASTDYAYDVDGMLASVLDTDPVGAELSYLGFRRDVEGHAFVSTRRAPLLPGLPPQGLKLTFDAAHQIVQRTNLIATGLETLPYVYDGRGRLLDDGVRTFEWTAFSRVKRIDHGATAKAFDYDGLGSLIRCTAGGTTTDFAVNYATDVPTTAIAREGGADRWFFIYLPDGQWIGAIDAATNEWLDPHFDEAGNTIYLTDMTSAVTDAWSYTAFGQVVDRFGMTPLPFTFGGAHGVHAIPDTDLYLWPNGNVYDSTTARFLARDGGPTLDPVHANGYTPIRGNPTGTPNAFMTGWQTAQNYWGGNPNFTPLDTGFIGDVFTGAGEKLFERLAERRWGQLANGLDLGKSIDGLDIGRALRFERASEIFGTAGNVLGAGQDFFSEATQAAEEGKGWGAIGARGAVYAGVGYAIGAASGPVALVDGVTGGNFQGAITQCYRVPEAAIRTALYGGQEYETYAQACNDGKYSWVVQKSHRAGELIGEELGEHGFWGGILSFHDKFTIQGVDETLLSLDYAWFGGPEPYQLPESVRARWEEQARSRRAANAKEGAR